MLLFYPTAIQKLAVEVDPEVVKACDERGCYHTWVKVEYEADYPDEIMLAVEVDDRVRKHAAAFVTLATVSPVLKSRAGWDAYIERMEG